MRAGIDLEKDKKKSVHERIMTCGHNDLIMQYMLKYLVMVLATVFIGLAGYELFNLFNGAESNAAFAALSGTTKGLIIFGTAAVGAGVLAVVVPKTIQYFNRREKRIISELERREASRTDDEKEKREDAHKTVEHTRDNLVDHIKFILDTERGSANMMRMVKISLENYADRVEVGVDKQELCRKIYPQIVGALKANGNREVIDFFDEARGFLPREKKCLQVLNDPKYFPGISRQVVMNSLERFGFDYNKVAEDPMYYDDFHKTFSDALSKLSRSQTIGFDKESGCIPVSIDMDAGIMRVTGVDDSTQYVYDSKYHLSEDKGGLTKSEQEEHENSYNENDNEFLKIEYNLSGYKKKLYDAFKDSNKDKSNNSHMMYALNSAILSLDQDKSSEVRVGMR